MLFCSGDDATLLKYFAKAKALADWLKARRETSLRDFTKDDPRYGLIAGLDEGDSFVHVYFHQGPYQTQHWYSHIAEVRVRCGTAPRSPCHQLSPP